MSSVGFGKVPTSSNKVRRRVLRSLRKDECFQFKVCGNTRFPGYTIQGREEEETGLETV